MTAGPRAGAPARAAPAPARSPRWWQALLGFAAKHNFAGAIYGLILATSVIAVTRKYKPGDAGVTAVTVIVTATVFWLAHVYAGVLAVGLAEHHTPTRADLRRIVDEEWPLVQAGVLPTAVLLLGPIGVVADAAAQDAAMVACLAELTVIGLAAARASGAPLPVVALSGLVSAGLGGVVIGLKVLVH